MSDILLYILISIHGNGIYIIYINNNNNNNFNIFSGSGEQHILCIYSSI